MARGANAIAWIRGAVGVRSACRRRRGARRYCLHERRRRGAQRDPLSTSRRHSGARGSACRATGSRIRGGRTGGQRRMVRRRRRGRHRRHDTRRGALHAECGTGGALRRSLRAVPRSLPAAGVRPLSAWKACDLRGVFPRDVSADLYGRIGRALATRLADGARVLVAGDFRLSTPELKAALISGLAASGAHVLDAGQIPTPMAYFAHRRLATDAVCIVTASHNPPDHNGLKLMFGHFPPSPSELQNLREASERGEFRDAPGSVDTLEAAPAYRAWICERWADIQPGMHVVLDAGNGAASVVGPALFEDLGFRVERLFCEIDGRYPNRAPDSAVAANLTALRAKGRETGARLGIAWDGDGDRVAFADESGNVVSADEMAVLLARHLAPAAPGRGVVYDLKLSDVVRRGGAS